MVRFFMVCSISFTSVGDIADVKKMIGAAQIQDLDILTL